MSYLLLLVSVITGFIGLPWWFATVLGATSGLWAARAALPDLLRASDENVSETNKAVLKKTMIPISIAWTGLIATLAHFIGGIANGFVFIVSNHPYFAA